MRRHARRVRLDGPDGGPVPYSLVADAYRADEGPGPDPEPCALPQAGTRAADDSTTLPPTEAGDAIRGRGGPDRLRGGAGDDCLYGNAGNDRLRGDAGADTLSCGPGRDRAIADAADTVKASCERARTVE